MVQLCLQKLAQVLAGLIGKIDKEAATANA
jgi:hypothetical protein